MIYAISPMKNGIWVILRGWEGCQAGQGDILEDGVREKNLQERLSYWKKELSK